MEVRRGSQTFTLGSLTSTVLDRAKWAGRDAWPSSPCFADEAERLFSFAHSRGVFELYLSELCSKIPQRDSALEELRVAFFLDRNSFRIVEGRPMGEAGRMGEFIAPRPSGEDMFVEVKSPGWESELSDIEKREGRRKQEKYIDGEGRMIDNGPAIAHAVEKAYPKL